MRILMLLAAMLLVSVLHDREAHGQCVASFRAPLGVRALGFGAPVRLGFGVGVRRRGVLPFVFPRAAIRNQANRAAQLQALGFQAANFRALQLGFRNQEFRNLQALQLGLNQPALGFYGGVAPLNFRGGDALGFSAGGNCAGFFGY